MNLNFLKILAIIALLIPSLADAGSVVLKGQSTTTIDAEGSSTIDGTPIGNTTASTIKGTTITDTGLNSVGVVTTSSAGLFGTNATLPATEFPALTGAVTTSAGSLSTSIANNAVTTATINANAVTDAKMATSTANSIAGYDNSGAHSTVTVGSGLSLAGGNLTATAAGVLAKSGATVNNTGNVNSQRCMASVTLPSMGANDGIQIWGLWSKGGTSTDTFFYGILLSTSACTPGNAFSSGTMIWDVTTSSSAALSLSGLGIFQNQNATNSQVFLPINVTTGLGSGGAFIASTSAIETGSATAYLNFVSNTVTSGSDTATLNAYWVRVIQ